MAAGSEAPGYSSTKASHTVAALIYPPLPPRARPPNGKNCLRFRGEKRTPRAAHSRRPSLPERNVVAPSKLTWTITWAKISSDSWTRSKRGKDHIENAARKARYIET